jgi:hypothetical protein
MEAVSKPGINVRYESQMKMTEKKMQAATTKLLECLRACSFPGGIKKSCWCKFAAWYSGVVKEAKEAGISNIRVLFKISEIAHWYTHKHHALRPVAAAWGQMNGEREPLDAGGSALVSKGICKLEAAVGMVWVTSWYRHKGGPVEQEKHLAMLREAHANLSPEQNAGHCARCKAWRDSHQEQVKEHRDSHREGIKEYRQDHKEERKEYFKQYHQSHKEEAEKQYRELGPKSKRPGFDTDARRETQRKCRLKKKKEKEAKAALAL